MVIVSSAWPGRIHTGPRTDLPSCDNSTSAPEFSCSFSAVAGLTIKAFSQVNFVWGRGSSCNQPLFPKRPSYTLGSGRNRMARPDVVIADLGGADLAGIDRP